MNENNFGDKKEFNNVEVLEPISLSNDTNINSSVGLNNIDDLNVSNTKSEVSRNLVSEVETLSFSNAQVNQSTLNQNSTSIHPEHNENESSGVSSSFGTMCFRYFIHFIILGVLVDFIVGLFTPTILKILPNILSFSSFWVLKLIFFLLFFFLFYFLCYYLLSLFSLHDTFLKGRTISFQNETRFLVFIMFIVPFLLFLVDYIVLHDVILTLSAIKLWICALATLCNRKKIKVK